MSRQSAALPVAYVLLRVLIVLNWLMGAAILALLLVSHEGWILRVFDLAPGPGASRLVLGLRAVAVVGLVTIPLNHLVLSRLQRITETVRRGDAFIAANAYRLHAIAWALLALQVISLIVGGIAKAASSPGYPLRLDAGFSPSGWLAVLLTFVLARIFAEGTALRRDLDGTV